MNTMTLYELNAGMTYDAVVNMLGKPNDTIGFGFSKYIYNLEDGSTAILWFRPNQNQSESTLFKLQCQDEQGKITEIPLD